MENINEKIASLEQWKNTTDTDMKELKKDVKEIKDKLLLSPSWAVLVIISFLTTICGILLTMKFD